MPSEARGQPGLNTQVGMLFSSKTVEFMMGSLEYGSTGDFYFEKARHIHSRTVSGPDGYCSVIVCLSVDSRIRTGLRMRHQVLLRVTSKKINTARLFFFYD